MSAEHATGLDGMVGGRSVGDVETYDWDWRECDCDEGGNRGAAVSFGGIRRNRFHLTAREYGEGLWMSSIGGGNDCHRVGNPAH